MIKRYLFIFLWVIAAIALIGAFMTPKTRRASTEEERFKCIAQYGWKTDEKPCDTAEITLPETSDLVYEEYNKMQRKSGFDLEPYFGKTVTRYTYKVYNHKNANGRQVYANILVSDGKMIAGDIMVTAANGFMHAINERLQE